MSQADSYADIAFDDFVSARQEARGVGNRVDMTGASGSELDPRDIKLIRQARMFMMATVTGAGWPYVQHKGGPPGFREGECDIRRFVPDVAGLRGKQAVRHRR